MDNCETRVLEEFLSLIGPSQESEERRRSVFNEIKLLLHKKLDDSVVITNFGSGPLKTYLPESDIDLTLLFKKPIVRRDPLAAVSDEPKCRLMEDISSAELQRFKYLLEEEAVANPKLRDISIINADVKLVKFYYDNMPVDLTFNQTGGICSLVFFEELDKELGKEHILKKSILMIKAWCLYEGHILGSHIGCFSTYALEVLILFVLNNFYDELQSPLHVFFKFFDVFGDFAWDDYIVTIYGPVSVALYWENCAYSDFNVNTLALDERKTNPRFAGKKLRITPSECLEKTNYFAELKRQYQQTHMPSWNKKGLALKHLNIVDPLFPGNNLGRSVSNFHHYRIKRVLRKGQNSTHELMALK